MLEDHLRQGPKDPAKLSDLIVWKEPTQEVVRDHLEMLFKRHEPIEEKIYRALRHELDRQRNIPMLEMRNEARQRLGMPSLLSTSGSGRDENEAALKPWTDDERNEYRSVVRDTASAQFSIIALDTIVDQVIDREINFCKDRLSREEPAFEDLYRSLQEFCHIPKAEDSLEPETRIKIRANVIRLLITKDPERIEHFKHELSLAALLEVAKSLAALPEGHNFSGGNAVLLLLTLRNKARALLNNGDIAGGTTPEEQEFKIENPEREYCDAALAAWSSQERQAYAKVLEDIGDGSVAKEIETIVAYGRELEIEYWMRRFAGTKIPFGDLHAALQEFCAIPGAEETLDSPTKYALRAQIIKNLIVEDENYIELAKTVLSMSALCELASRIITVPQAPGLVGGKSAGMILAFEFLREDKRFAQFMPLAVPESYYLSTAVFDRIFESYELDEFETVKEKPTFADYEEAFGEAKNVLPTLEPPKSISSLLLKLLDKIGERPIIVRSSSLLEDRREGACSGKYKSIFLANQGSIEARMAKLWGAVTEVYASTLDPDALWYRKEFGLDKFDERMGILIQEVVGNQCGKYFLPSFAGVAFSWNDCVWADPETMRPEDGLMRIVVGMGAYAVDREGQDFPRMVALGRPTTRAESVEEDGEDGVVRESQRKIKALNLEHDIFETIFLRDILTSSLAGADNKEAEGYIPMLHLCVERYEDGTFYRVPPIESITDKRGITITFNPLTATAFPAQMKALLQALEKLYGTPVDIEFASDGAKLYILQCRPLAVMTETGRILLPENLPRNQIVVHAAEKVLQSFQYENLQYIVYVDPFAYSSLSTKEEQTEVAHALVHINEALPKKDFLVIGPGRWGSRDLALGVGVKFAGISRCAALIEVAAARLGFKPENVSRGTHWFNDLTEAKISCFSVDSESPKSFVNTDELYDAPNIVEELIPDIGELRNVIRVVRVPDIAGDKTLEVRGDAITRQAMVFFRGK